MCICPAVAMRPVMDILILHLQLRSVLSLLPLDYAEVGVTILQEQEEIQKAILVSDYRYRMMNFKSTL